MWDVRAFREIIERTAKRIRGEKDDVGNEIFVKNKEALYQYLCQKLNVSYDTVKSWTRPKSNGPSDPDTLYLLENILGTCLHTTETKPQKKEKKEMKKYSDFVKGQVKKAYDLMKDYLHTEEVEDENLFCEMVSEIEKLQIAIPKEIYSKIITFVDENLSPIIYDNSTVFADLYSGEFGFLDDANCFHFHDESKETVLNYMARYYSILIDIEKRLDTFAMTKLYPLLISD